MARATFWTPISIGTARRCASGFFQVRRPDPSGQAVVAELAKATGPALIEIRTDPNVSHPDATIDELRNKAKAK